ncbi:MAG: hypothetical protein WB930_02750 [Syntrophobacteraceae bacterium]
MPEDRKKEIIVHIRNLGRLSQSKIYLDSCLSEVKGPLPGLECDQRFNANEEKERAEYLTKLHPMLTELACEYTALADGLMQQAIHPAFGTDDDILVSTSTRQGLATQFAERISDESCPGLSGLSPEKKKLIQDAAKQGK